MIPGNYYSVPCIEKYDKNDRNLLLSLTPVIPLKHDDYHNGQFYEHYHLDSRFCIRSKITAQATNAVKLKSGLEIHCELRPKVEEDTKLITYKLMLYRTNYEYITNVINIDKAPIKHPCIVNGKCPHKGFDLIDPNLVKNGIITCPLHGLQFHADSGIMIDEHQYLLGIKENPGTDILIMPWKD